MGISVCVKDWDKLVKAEIEANFTAEEIAFCDKWQNSYGEEADASYEAYSEKIKPIEYKYTMDFANGNFKELLEMLDMEFSYCGELSGVELSEFCLKLRNLRNIALNNPVEFCSPTIVYEGEGVATMISMGKDVSYWISRVSELIELCEKTESISWG